MPSLGIRTNLVHKGTRLNYTEVENIIVNGNFSQDSTIGWLTNGSLSVVNGRLRIQKSVPNYPYGQYLINTSVGDKIYLSHNVYPILAPATHRYYNISGTVIHNVYTTSLNQKRSSVYTSVGGDIYPRFTVETVNAGIYIEVDNIIAINLTAVFGAGNEPSQEKCDLIFTDYWEGKKKFYIHNLKITSPEMVTILTNMTNDNIIYPSTVTINGYEDYANPPQSVIDAVELFKTTKSVTTVNLGA